MTVRLRVAIVAANTFEYDSRLLRTASALVGAGHTVTILGLAGPGLPEREQLPSGAALRRLPLDRRVTSAFRPLPQRARRLLARVLGFDPEATQLPPGRPHGLDRLRAPLRRVVEIAAHARRVGPWADAVVGAAPDADVFHAKALIALPVVHAAARRTRARFVYDVADIHTEAARLARMPGGFRALVRRREAAWMRAAAGLMAVSDAVAREVARRFAVPEPVVMLNCPPRWRPEDPEPPRSDRLRAALGAAGRRPLVIYQGGFSVDRGIEELVAALDEPGLRDRPVAVVLLGYGRLRDSLREEAARRPGRLYVLDAVPPGELLEWTASADVSFVGQPPRTLNQRLNLANKLFESMMAGVPVIVAQETEHCRLVTAEGLGRCCEVAPSAIATAIAALLDPPPEARAALRARVRRAALERYAWEIQQTGLVALYGRLAETAS